MAIFSSTQALAFLNTLIAFISIAFANSKSETTDIHALLDFKSKITSDPLHVMESWNESTPLCQWYGVTCGSRHKRVQNLYLNSSNIAGTISPHMGNLSFLRGLSLENNGFIGNIPPEIGQLHRLRFLSLRNNSLTGVIPSNMSNCYNLRRMDFYDNNLEGEIPTDLSSLLKLSQLSLGRNRLYGQIPPSLGNLSNLETLILSENKLTGVLPNTLGQLNRLARLLVESNGLSGLIPPSIYNLSSLNLFSVFSNLIHGSLPPDLFNTLPNLQQFLIWENQITGSIPISLSNASNLFSSDIGDNNFIGKIPSLERLNKLAYFGVIGCHLGSNDIDDLYFLHSITNNTSLELLEISHNNFGGILPKSIGNLSSLHTLGMVDNNIFGSIPTEIGNLLNLEALGISGNQLVGEIPSSIGNLENLVRLYLEDNKLSGKIPSSLGKLKKLIDLYLANNKLQGMIPYTLGECKSLNYLRLSTNDLVGSIPKEIFQIPQLLAIGLSQNRLVGPIPELIENLQNLNLLDVSENMLSQTIPNSLGKCILLEELLMQGNFFEGMIPPSLGNLRGINMIDLSRNNLSGQIPRSLVDLMFVQNLNLSYNNLEGPVPEAGVFRNASRFAITRNKKLCGGIPKLMLPKCDSGISHEKASHIVVKVILGVLIGLLGMSLICLWLFYQFKKKRHIVTQNSFSDNLLRVTYQSLLKATNGFSSTNKLGSGNFGSVYKANLDITNTIVAVKVFDLQKHGASRSFLAECKVLKRIRHRNLVKILTACSSIDFSGNEFKALVYEFMANGSLEDWLHPFPIRQDTIQPRRHLRLIQRLNIAFDVACALDYLHCGCEIPIIHCDIKPSNVLLDDEMIGHVGDFGLSKILSDASNNTMTSETTSTTFKGTIGYIAPEYGMGASMSTQGDVYSFGVLLLEMFTGMRPNDDIFHGSININRFVKAALPDKVAEIADPTLLAEIEEFSSARNSAMEYLIAIFEIGVSCSATLPVERKSMGDVVAELQYVQKEILGNQTLKVR